MGDEHSHEIVVVTDQLQAPGIHHSSSAAAAAQQRTPKIQQSSKVSFLVFVILFYLYNVFQDRHWDRAKGGHLGAVRHGSPFFG